MYKDTTYTDKNIPFGFSEYFKDTFRFPHTLKSRHNFTDDLEALIEHSKHDRSFENSADYDNKVMVAPFNWENVETVAKDLKTWDNSIT